MERHARLQFDARHIIYEDGVLKNVIRTRNTTSKTKWLSLPGLALLLGILIASASVPAATVRTKPLQTAKDIIETLEEKARQVELEAKENALRITREAEEDLQRRRAELSKEDDRLSNGAKN